MSKIEIDYAQTSPEYYLNKAKELTDKFRVGFIEWPNSLPEAFELFREFNARKWLLIEISGFLDKFHSWNERAMNEELTEIKQFISKTSAIKLETAFKDGYFSGDQKEIVYLRLDNDYYINKKNIQSDWSVAESVYGRYFLFKELLKQKLNQDINAREISQLKTNLTDDTQRGLLFDLLVKDRFILNENKDCFIWAFGGNVKLEKYIPIKWIKTNSRTNGKNLNKVSVLNLLHILKVKGSQIVDKSLINKLFAKPDGKSIKFTSSNYPKKGYDSEYNLQLTEIVNKSYQKHSM